MAKPGSRSLFAPILSAVLLYLFSVAFGALAAALVPYLLELMEKSVRLGALGWLGLLGSPIAFIGCAHGAAHGVMDGVDPAKERPSRRFASARAGMFGWFAMGFSSIASGFLLLAILPPPPEEDGLAALLRVATDVRLELGLHALLWIGIAAVLFHVERAGARAAT